MALHKAAAGLTRCQLSGLRNGCPNSLNRLRGRDAEKPPQQLARAISGYVSFPQWPSPLNFFCKGH